MSGSGSKPLARVEVHQGHPAPAWLREAMRGLAVRSHRNDVPVLVLRASPSNFNRALAVVDLCDLAHLVDVLGHEDEDY